MLKNILLPALTATFVILSISPAGAVRNMQNGIEADALTLYAEAEKLAPTDVLGAMGLYCRAARLGHAPSQVKLGAYYLQGQYVEEDLAAAMLWFDIANHNGAPEAREMRRTVGRMARTEDFTRYRYYNNNRDIIPCDPRLKKPPAATPQSSENP